MTNVAVDVLLGVAVAAQLVSCAGLALMRTTADRLHYTSAGFTVGPFCVLAALIVREGIGSIGLQSVAAVGLLFLAGPVVVHATARALRRIELGEVRPRLEERAP
ncbi:monovalent cation/H(+) antiporter subunit G [Gaiella sp.]|jgi:multisubunit Na+/H+ antiporter MnhG subunit|uniref:monovalent cation/H(+) antiporter subunit G n=1 Tax=Gaiella sp. TaxID=2663207 RepID=UPI002E316D6B|nr:monovalent cation/H(+) antiporter subunit G [Gaiella sp.]HEX5583846.1 monovalent cation/H(+) antiporter subunit G [Gaiella sp.]